MFSRQEKILLALMAAINFTHIVDFMIMMPLGPQLMRMFNIDPHQFGLLVSSYTFAAGISGFLASLFVDRFDRKGSLLFFYAGFALGTVACATAREYHWLLLARSITGAFGGVMGSLVFSTVSDAISAERRGTAMGIVMGAFSIASIAGVPFSLYLANTYDWHSPFMFLGVAALAIALLVSLVMPSMKGHLKGPHGTAEQNPFFALKHILTSPNQLKAFALLFFIVAGQFGMIPFLSPSFVANGGLPEAQLPLIYLFGGLASMITSPIVGRLSDRFGKKTVFMISCAVSIAPMVGITYLRDVSVPFLLFVSTLFFLVMGGRMVPLMTFISMTATPRFRGSFMSVSASIQQLSAALASYVAGIVITKDSQGHLLNYEYIGWSSAIFSVLAIWMARKVHPAESDSTSPR